MAVDLDGNITDLYEGQEDLRQGIVRTVGMQTNVLMKTLCVCLGLAVS